MRHLAQARPTSVTGRAFAAGGAEGVSSMAPIAPDFIGTPSGDLITVPEGATGPFPTRSPSFQFNGGSSARF